MSGEIFGHNRSNSTRFQVQLFTCCDLSVFPYLLDIYSRDSSKTISNFLKVWNINWLFLKLNLFICIYLFFLETKGRQASAKAHEIVDYLASFPSDREESS